MAASLAVAGPARQQLDTFLQDVITLKAVFTEQRLSPNSDEPVTVSGHLYLNRPSQFRWEYSGEEGQLIVADGRRVWLVEPDLEQVSHRSQKGAFAGTPGWLLTGQGDITDSFEVKEFGEYQGGQWLVLTPRDPDSQFERILLALDDNLLTRLEVADRLGGRSIYQFSDIEVNPALPENLFEYEPPTSFDLLEQ